MMQSVETTPINYRLLNEGCSLTRGTEYAAGWDARANVPEPVILEPGRRKLIPLGFQLELPLGWEAQVRPRSGLALKHGLTVLNAPGTVDADYRGEVCAILINHGENPYQIEPLERVAQIVFARVADVHPATVTEISETVRGAGGFASTGRH